jgi:Fe2+ or Zn2+ uptake regulation protein
VYRNLKTLVASGLVREVHRAHEAVRYDGNTGEHYHIRCVSCDRVSDLPVSVDRAIERRAEAATNYAILGHEVEVYGVCPHCHQGAFSKRESFSNQRKSQKPQTT